MTKFHAFLIYMAAQDAGVTESGKNLIQLKIQP